MEDDESNNQGVATKKRRNLTSWYLQEFFRRRRACDASFLFHRTKILQLKRRSQIIRVFRRRRKLTRTNCFFTLTFPPKLTVRHLSGRMRSRQLLRIRPGPVHDQSDHCFSRSFAFEIRSAYYCDVAEFDFYNFGMEVSILVVEPRSGNRIELHAIFNKVLMFFMSSSLLYDLIILQVGQ